MTVGAAWLAARLSGAGDPVIIDGGMGTQLQRSGVPMHGKVWSGAAVLTHPEAVQRAHEDFIRAGAEVIITNTFAAGRHMLEPGGLGEHVTAINTQAVRVAQQARDAVAERPVAILGSICEWALPGESRWSTPAGVAESAVEQAQLLCAAGVDALALEMCQLVEFSHGVIEAALQTALPIWIGVSARRHPGTAAIASFDRPERRLDELVRELVRHPAMLLAVMHTPVPDVAEALEVMRRHWQGALGVYPESGYFEMPNWRFVDVIAPEALADAAQDWLRAGVRAIGGCCGLGPEHIAALVAALRRAGRISAPSEQ